MRMLPNRRKQDQQQASSLLDKKARALAEQEEKLRIEIERRERLIKEAPQIALEQERLRREEIVKRASRVDAHSPSRAVIPDPRHHLPSKPGEIPRGRKMRVERRRGRFLFFILLCTFGAVVYWAYFTFTHQ